MGPSVTGNVALATLVRTDMPAANPYDFYNLDKIEMLIQAEPPESTLAFKVVYVDAGHNGFDPAAYGRAPNAPSQAKASSAARLR